MTNPPAPKDHLDTFGTVSLIAFALLLAFNQVVIAVGGDGWQPVFMAALRSLGAAVVLFAWLKFRRIDYGLERRMWGTAVLMGAIFGFEFLLLFTALDLTSVSRASVIFYAMPVWAALGSRVFLGERFTAQKAAGLTVAFLGMAWAIWDGQATGGSLAGDLCAMGASMGWASILLVIKGSNVKDLPAEVQLFWQVLISIPVLLVGALFFGPLVRELELIHWAALIFQIFAVASFGFLFWFWLIKIYPATSVASFSFLSPVFSVLLGAILLGEAVGVQLLGALLLVTLGLILINRRPRQVPQKV
ncbi:MAG: DMT family transporter [Pseudomonadota bacterium]